MCTYCIVLVDLQLEIFLGASPNTLHGSFCCMHAGTSIYVVHPMSCVHNCFIRSTSRANTHLEVYVEHVSYKYGMNVTYGCNYIIHSKSCYAAYNYIRNAALLLVDVQMMKQLLPESMRLVVEVFHIHLPAMIIGPNLCHCNYPGSVSSVVTTVCYIKSCSAHHIASQAVKRLL